MASSKGKGRFPHAIENKGRRENPGRQNRWPDQPRACSGHKDIHTWADSRPGEVHLVAQPHWAGACGELALSFTLMASYCLCRTAHKKIPPGSPANLHSHHLLQLKYPPLACLLWNRTTKRKGLMCYVLSLYSCNIHLCSFHGYLCFSDSAHKGSPIRSASALYFNLGKLTWSLQSLGTPWEGLPASVTLPWYPPGAPLIIHSALSLFIYYPKNISAEKYSRNV